MKKGKNILTIILLGVFLLGFGVGDVFFLYEGKKSLQIEHTESKVKTEQKDYQQQKNQEREITYTSSLDSFQVRKMNDTKTKNENQKDYILKDSDSKYYKAKDLKGLSKWEVQLARNEIYARHGRKFTTDEVREYFEGKDWYHGTVEEVEDSELNKYEIANRDMIQKYEKSKGWR